MGRVTGGSELPAFCISYSLFPPPPLCFPPISRHSSRLLLSPIPTPIIHSPLFVRLFVSLPLSERLEQATKYHAMLQNVFLFLPATALLGIPLPRPLFSRLLYTSLYLYSGVPAGSRPLPPCPNPTPTRCPCYKRDLYSRVFTVLLCSLLIRQKDFPTLHLLNKWTARDYGGEGGRTASSYTVEDHKHFSATLHFIRRFIIVARDS